MVVAAIAGMRTIMNSTATMTEARNGHKPTTGALEKRGPGDEGVRMPGSIGASSATGGVARRFYPGCNMLSATDSSCTIF